MLFIILKFKLTSKLTRIFCGKLLAIFKVFDVIDFRQTSPKSRSSFSEIQIKIINNMESRKGSSCHDGEDLSSEGFWSINAFGRQNNWSKLKEKIMNPRWIRSNEGLLRSAYFFDSMFTQYFKWGLNGLLRKGTFKRGYV